MQGFPSIMPYALSSLHFAVSAVKSTLHAISSSTRVVFTPVQGTLFKSVLLYAVNKMSKKKKCLKKKKSCVKQSEDALQEFYHSIGKGQRF